MNLRLSLFLGVFLAVAIFVSGCASVQQRRVYTCPNPSCRQVIPASATICPNCGQRLMPVAAQKASAGGNPPAVAQASGEEKKKFLPVKVGALLEITDSNHQRVAPFISVEVFKYKLEKQKIILCVDVGIAEDALLAAAGVRGIVPDAPYLGGFFFIMVDNRRTLKPRLYGAHQSHFCTGLGITLGGF